MTTAGTSSISTTPRDPRTHVTCSCRRCSSSAFFERSTGSSAQQDSFLSTFERLTLTRSSSDKKTKAKERAKQRARDRQTMLLWAQELLGLQNSRRTRFVVFICVDVEALEVPPHPVSEVGIAILDAKHTEGVASGPGGSNWYEFIEAHHLRTKEYSGVTNHKFVHGCPDAFDFGKSTFTSLEELPNAIAAILKPYLDRRRDLVLVAHDVMQDIRYLSDIGLEIRDLQDMKGTIDTREMHQAWSDSDSGRRLQAVLADLGIASANLHNAGNNAVYTLRGVMGLAVEQVRKDEAKDRNEEYVPALWAS